VQQHNIRTTTPHHTANTTSETHGKLRAIAEREKITEEHEERNEQREEIPTGE
jgi:hypothetical protein